MAHKVEHWNRDTSDKSWPGGPPEMINPDDDARGVPEPRAAPTKIAVAQQRPINNHARRPFRVSKTPTPVELASIDPETRVELLRELERYRRECGCGAGGVGVVAGFILVIAWQLASITTFTLSTAAIALVQIVAATVIGGVAGKLVGLGRARARFRRVTARLLAQDLTMELHTDGTR